MNIVILQRLPVDLDAIKVAMEKLCPELLENTTFLSYLDDAKDIVKAKKKNLLKKIKKDVLVITGTVLTDYSTPKVINRLKDWNPWAEIIVFSVQPTDVMKDDKVAKKVSMIMFKHKTEECYAQLAEVVKKRYEAKTQGKISKII